MTTSAAGLLRGAVLLLAAAGMTFADPAYVTIDRGISKSYLPWSG
jgi:hypothetical protein